jgi:hypothetical protein
MYIEASEQVIYNENYFFEGGLIHQNYADKLDMESQEKLDDADLEN